MKPQLFIRNGALGSEPQCPCCHEVGRRFTHLAASPDRRSRPKPGDIAVCKYCSSVLVLFLGARGLDLRLATAEECLGVRGPLSVAEMVQLTQDHRRERQQ